MSLFHRGPHDLEMIREEHGHTGESDLGTPGKKVIPIDDYATKIVTAGSIVYIGKALPGASESDAVWQAKKIDRTTGAVITWADGNSRFDNTATDLSALTYS